MRSARLLTLAVVAVVLVGTSGISAAQPAGPDVDVSYEDETISVTMTDSDGSVSGLDISIEPVEGSYESAGTYTTDEDGTISVPAPESTVTLQFSTTYQERSLSQEITVEGTAADASSEDVDLEQGGTGPELPSQIPEFVQNQNPQLSQLIGGQSDDTGEGDEVVTFALEELPGDANLSEDFEGEPPENFTGEDLPENVTEEPPEDFEDEDLPENFTEEDLPENVTEEPPEDFEDDPGEAERDTDGDGNFDPDDDFNDSNNDDDGDSDGTYDGDGDGDGDGYDDEDDDTYDDDGDGGYDDDGDGGYDDDDDE